MISFHRHARSLLVLSLVLTSLRCASSQNHTRGTGLGPDVCSGTPNPYAPIVCVNDSSSSLPADPAEVHAVNRVPGRRPTVIQWFTTSGTNDLSITFEAKDAACFQKAPNCEGSHCMALINPAAAPGKQCKYTIRLLNKPGSVNDPVVDIDACCPAP